MCVDYRTFLRFFFSVLDLKMAEFLIKYTTFLKPFGQYEYNLPLGLKNVPFVY